MQPDLIILDVMMPQRSGVSIYRELRSCTELNCTPVAIMSGFAPQDGTMPTGFQQMVPEAGIQAPDGFIDKPIDLEALVALVRKLTEKE
jgi:DNA-binding response OmpR family regulator